MRTFRLNGNTSTRWFQMLGGDSVHVTCEGDFGGGNVNIEKRIFDTAYPVRDSAGDPLVYTAEFDVEIGLKPEALIRVTVDSATAPAIVGYINGQVEEVAVLS